jgi:sugar phosphate permease
MGLLSSGVALGGVLGLMLGGFLEHHYGWRVAFMTVGVPGFLCGVLVARLYDPGRPPVDFTIRWFFRRKQLTAPSDAELTPFAVTISNTLDEMTRAGKLVLHTPTLIYVFIAGALISFGTNGIVGWGPTFVSRELGLSPAQAAALLGKWGLIAGTTGTLFGGMLADWLRQRFVTARVITVAAGLLLGGPLAVWLLTIRDPALFQVVFFAAFFCLSWYNGPNSAVIFDVVPRRISATVAGAYLLFVHLAGDAIALPLVGVLSDQFGLHRAVLLLPVLVIVGGIVVLGAIRTVGTDMQRVAQA